MPSAAGQFSGHLNSGTIIGDFYPRYEQELANSWAPLLSVDINSTQETENYKWIGQTPVMREWLGGRHLETLKKFSLAITNKKYEATLRIDLDDLRRDATGQLRVRVAEMAQRAATQPESLLSTLILNGDATTSGLCYDGQQYFDTDHDESGSDQVNNLSSSHIAAADVTTAAAPTATEASNVIAQAIGYMLGYTDDKGEPVNGSARNWLVMVGTAPLWNACSQAAVLDVFAAGADNPLRGIKAAGMNVSVIYNPRLSADTVEINIFRLDGIGWRPFIHQTEVPLETQLLGAGSDLEFNEDAHQFGVKVVRAVGFGAWQHGAQITLS